MRRARRNTRGSVALLSTCPLKSEAADFGVIGDTQLHEPRNASTEKRFIDGVLQSRSKYSAAHRMP
jgi:hypothetical protein